MRSDNLVIKHPDGLTITYILLHDSRTALKKFKDTVEDVQLFPVKEEYK